MRDGQERQAERIVELCKKNDVREIRVAKSDDERNQLWAGRQGAFGAIARIAPATRCRTAPCPAPSSPRRCARVIEIAAQAPREGGQRGPRRRRQPAPAASCSIPRITKRWSGFTRRARRS